MLHPISQLGSFRLWNVDMIVRAVEATVSTTISVVQVVFGGEYHIPLLIVVKMLTLYQFLFHPSILLLAQFQFLLPLLKDAHPKLGR